MKDYLAHVRQAENGEWIIHHLEEHLRKVAKLAAEYAEPFGNGDWAFLAGVLHDLGKYRKAFQTHIESGSGYRPDAHLEAPGEDSQHAIAGAVHAVNVFGEVGELMAYLIAGHHAGLPDWQDSGSQASLKWRLGHYQSHADEVLREDVPDDIRQPAAPTTMPAMGIDVALWLRMLFSCLVDADFLDTERFMDEGKAKKRAGYPNLSALKLEFDGYMHAMSAGAERSNVNQLRQSILQDCCDNATNEPGFFTLTVPTGGGKTLASMAFALRHAAAHKKRRVIYVIPYTSIIEQTADVYRKAFGQFGDECIVEHHSNIDYDEGAAGGSVVDNKARQAKAKARVAAENWDAPIIITTAVQFFESLFAAKPSRCRKLHNIADSVIIFDEAQTLPVDFLEPVLAALKELVTNYGVTAVLCTATQPMLFEKPAGREQFPKIDRETCREIISAPQQLYEQLKRVRVNVPTDMNVSIGYPEIAEKLSEQSQGLCIVDRRAAAAELFELLPEEGRFHLSTRMCGQHRSDVIAVIKQRLKDGEVTRLVSTQLIEAGVDLDFPVVYRAMAGLDSIAQAAGRCNREGRLKEGVVNLFIPEGGSPKAFSQSIDAGREVLRHNIEDPLSLNAISEYFQHYYWRHGERLDKYEIRDLLLFDASSKGGAISYRTAAKKFQLIDDSWQAPVIVRYKNNELIEQLENIGPERWLLRKLQRYVVNIPATEHQKMLGRDIREIASGIFVQEESDVFYSEDVGVRVDGFSGFVDLCV